MHFLRRRDRRRRYIDYRDGSRAPREEESGVVASAACEFEVGGDMDVRVEGGMDIVVFEGADGGGKHGVVALAYGVVLC